MYIAAINSLYPLPVYLLSLFILQITIRRLSIRLLILLTLLTLYLLLRFLIRRPNPLNTQLKRPLDTIRQPNADSPHLLPQQLRLRLNNKPVIRTHKVIPLDQHRLPLARPLGKQPVLVQIRRLDAVGLQVDKVRAAVGLDAQRYECVGINVPDGVAKGCGGLVGGAEGGVAGALDPGAVGREGGGYASVEAHV